MLASCCPSGQSATLPATWYVQRLPTANGNKSAGLIAPEPEEPLTAPKPALPEAAPAVPARAELSAPAFGSREPAPAEFPPPPDGPGSTTAPSLLLPHPKARARQQPAAIARMMRDEIRTRRIARCHNMRSCRRACPRIPRRECTLPCSRASACRSRYCNSCRRNNRYPCCRFRLRRDT